MVGNVVGYLLQSTGVWPGRSGLIIEKEAGEAAEAVESQNLGARSTGVSGFAVGLEDAPCQIPVLRDQQLAAVWAVQQKHAAVEAVNVIFLFADAVLRDDSLVLTQEAEGLLGRLSCGFIRRVLGGEARLVSELTLHLQDQVDANVAFHELVLDLFEEHGCAFVHQGAGVDVDDIVHAELVQHLFDLALSLALLMKEGELVLQSVGAKKRSNRLLA